MATRLGGLRNLNQQIHLLIGCLNIKIMKYFLSVVICIFINYTSYAQYKKMTNEEMVIRKFKVSKTDFSNLETLHSFMSTFDQNYRSYYRNEFELNKNETRYKNYIQSSINNVNEQEIFYYDLPGYSEFGEYDFTSNQFRFTPFKEYEERNGNKGRHLEVYGERRGDLESEILIRNLDFVNGLAMSNDDAQAFLKNKTSNGRIDRTVYLRIYYAVHMDRTTNIIGMYSFGGTDYDECLSGEPLRVEVWEDKCRINNLLATYYPDRNDISQKFYPLLEKLSSNKPLSNNYVNHSPNDNFRYLYSWSKINDKCSREFIELHIKKQHINTEQNILQIRLFTNYNYNIKPGFIFNFFNKETNTEFPLVVYEASVDNDASLLKVKATDITLNQIINADCTSIKLQLSGYPKYSIPGGGVMVNDGFDWSGSEIWLFLSDQNKQTLRSTLKQ